MCPVSVLVLLVTDVPFLEVVWRSLVCCVVVCYVLWVGVSISLRVWVCVMVKLLMLLMMAGRVSVRTVVSARCGRLVRFLMTMWTLSWLVWLRNRVSVAVFDVLTSGISLRCRTSIRGGRKHRLSRLLRWPVMVKNSGFVILQILMFGGSVSCVLWRLCVLRLLGLGLISRMFRVTLIMFVTWRTNSSVVSIMLILTVIARLIVIASLKAVSSMVWLLTGLCTRRWKDLNLVTP